MAESQAEKDQSVEQHCDLLTDLILSAGWADGGKDGFPTKRIASMLAEHLYDHGVRAL